MKNHDARPTGAAPFPEVNAASHQYDGGRGHGRGRGHGHSNDRGRGRDHIHIGNFKNSYSRQKRKNNEKGNGGQS
ncbi:putative zinc knuckle protein, partial [Trifolium medium]|nr:putative zinc knuckle protein [Trifolium medium]